MLKILIMTIHLMTTQYTVETNKDVPTAFAYNWIKAECIIDSTNYAACSATCLADMEYLSTEWIVDDLPICAEVFDRLNIEIEQGGE